MIIDASDLILGRIATIAAKSSLLGREVSIINCEEAVITGSKESILGKYEARRQMGSPFQGPFLPRRPDMFVKRAIRGMLPYKKQKGRAAFEKIKCHIGIPDELQDKKFDTIEEANVNKIPNRKFMKVKDLCHELGAR